jgi:hypothetical protein
VTQWYRRYEINFRIALFFSAATAAGAFGGLLARLINFMDGVGGYEGWVRGSRRARVTGTDIAEVDLHPRGYRHRHRRRRELLDAVRLPRDDQVALAQRAALFEG